MYAYTDKPLTISLPPLLWKNARKNMQDHISYALRLFDNTTVIIFYNEWQTYAFMWGNGIMIHIVYNKQLSVYHKISFLKFQIILR